MQKNNRKKVIIYLSAMLILLNLFNIKNKKINKDKQLTSSDVHSFEYSYGKGNVYFCNSLDAIAELKETIQESDVIVVDQSDCNDPNMKVISSYKITNIEDMKKIIKIIKEFCNSNVSCWNRSVESMENEWIIHNLCSNFHIKRSSTDDVDFNNADEDFYNSKIIGKMLGN